MESINLEQINRNLILLRKEIERIASIVEESYLELDDEVDNEVMQSRKRNKKEIVSHEEMKKEFGDDND